MHSQGESSSTNTTMSKKISPYMKLLGVVLVVSLFSNVFLVYTHYSEGKQERISPEEQEEKYSFLSKRVFLEEPNDVIINFVPLRKALKEYLALHEKVGVYFEYLPSGISVGVNDRKEVRLASLSKVPLVMSILKKIEKGEMQKDTEITILKEDLDSEFGAFWESSEGKKVTVETLMALALQKSDNTAYKALFRQLTSEEVVEVYDNLEIEVLFKDDNPLVSPKLYSSIFRSLYLASYLSKEDSNYVLDLLTKTDFYDKIPAGVPVGIPVSHKIGVLSKADSEEKVFTDCGIVYVPKRPYILCAFVEDSDEEAKKHISYISKMVYSYLQVVKGGNE